jgi:glucose/arabinose dehydrogenase
MLAETPGARPAAFRRILTVTLAIVLVTACGPSGSTLAPSGRSPSPVAGASSLLGTGGAAGSPSVVPPAGAVFDPTGLTVGLETVVEGLAAPLSITTAGDGSGRMFVVQQGGQIRIVRDGALVGKPFLDIAGRITSGGERGLLGLAFHPDYPTDPRLFVNYTDANGDTQVSSFTVDPSQPDVASADSETQLLHIAQPYANHNGGAVVFGPDGYLYVSTGDGGSGGDPRGNGQSIATLLGKILRIDVDQTAGAYAIPPDNPFVGKADAQPEIFLYGLRNPWRMSFDRATDDLWFGDVGQGAWEEVDVARSRTSGQNFGWNTMEGNHCFNPSDGCDRTGLTLPVAEYSHEHGCTVIGGNVYRGKAQPALVGGYFFGDYCSGTIWAIDPSSDTPRDPMVVLQGGASISSFGEDEAGELYATDIGGGRLLRLTGRR